MNSFWIVARTCDAGVAGLQVGRKVSLTRPYVDQRSHTNIARLTTRALGVKQRYDVIGTAQVIVATDTASQSHPSVHR